MNQELQNKKVALYEMNQNHLRQKLINESRQILMKLHDIDTDMDIEIEEVFQDLSLSNDIKPKKYSKHQIYISKLFTQPQYIYEKPKKFEINEWNLIFLPQGKRCIVMSKNHKTTSRDLNGQIIESFDSGLPGGSRSHLGSGSNSLCILECLFSDNIYYVIDLLIWKNQIFYDSPFELRQFWLQSTVFEESNKISQINSYNKFEFKLVTTTDIKNHSEIIFNLKQNKTMNLYQIQGWYVASLSPFIQCWYDINQQQKSAFLTIDQNFYLRTIENFNLCKLNQPQISKFQNFIGQTIQINYDEIIINEDQKYYIKKFEISNNTKIIPDSLCKILFNYHQYQNKKTIENILSYISL